MAELPLDQAVARFQENEVRIDRFVNAPWDEDVYETSEGALVPVLPKLLPLVTAAAERAEFASVATLSARDTTVLDALIAEDVAAGLAATSDTGLENRFFRTFSENNNESFIYYRHDPGAIATEMKRYPNADSVQRPSWAGQSSGWPDPFFRNLEIGENFDELTRWYTPLASGEFKNWIKVRNSIFAGSALRRLPGKGLTELSGPIIHLSDIGAAPGDRVTVKALIIGSGGTVFFPGRPMASNFSSTGVQQNASPASIVASAVPQLMTLSFVAPPGTDMFRVYPYTPTEDQGFDIVALWAHSGAPEAGQIWPIFNDGEYFSTSLKKIKSDALDAMAPLAYAITYDQLVVADSESVSLDVSGSAVSTVYGLPFRGWGESFSPAGVAFNAVRAMYIGRAETEQPGRWRKINVIVKTGDPASAGNVVAVGSVAVDPDLSFLEEVTIVLRDPVTGAVKTLSDADLGAQYFIGMYAENANGEPAAMSQILATQANSLGQSYYLTTASPAAAWSVTSGSNRVGFQHLLLSNPREEIRYRATKEFKSSVASESESEDMLFWSPPAVYLTQGIEGSVYLDGLLAEDALDYAWSAASAPSSSKLQSERWTIKPTSAVAAAAVKIRAHAKASGNVVFESSFAVIGAPLAAGDGITRKVQLIGDSFAHAGVMTQTLLDNAQVDLMGIELIGTRGTTPNRHEGRGGWRIDDYATVGRTYYQFAVSGVVVNPQINSTVYWNNGSTFTVQEFSLNGGAGTITCSANSGAPGATGDLTKVSGAGDESIAFSASSTVSGNPFWFAGALNYAQYLEANELDTPDTVLIELGVNDVFGQSTDAGAAARAEGQFALLDTLIASIKAAGVAIVGLIPPAGPSGSQDAFAASYGAQYQKWRVKRNNIIWNRVLVERYAGQTGQGVYIVPAGLNWDTVNNASYAASTPANSRSTVQVTRMNNGVHPATSGYQQIGDAIWAFLKCTA